MIHVTEKTTIGNGKGLPITHIDSASLSTSNATISLDNVLPVLE